MPKYSDILTIMQGCKQGDPVAQKALVMSCSETLYSVSLRYMRHDADAQDVLQESLIKVFRAIQTFDPKRGNAMGWMRRIVINTALKQISKRAHTDEIEDYYDYESIDPEALSDLKAEDLMEVVKSLPPMYRKVFNLSVIDGYNHKEIGDLLGINESTSRSNLARAKCFLRKQLLKLENHESWVTAK